MAATNPAWCAFAAAIVEPWFSSGYAKWVCPQPARRPTASRPVGSCVLSYATGARFGVPKTLRSTRGSAPRTSALAFTTRMQTLRRGAAPRAGRWNAGRLSGAATLPWSREAIANVFRTTLAARPPISASASTRCCAQPIPLTGIGATGAIAPTGRMASQPPTPNPPVRTVSIPPPRPSARAPAVQHGSTRHR